MDDHRPPPWIREAPRCWPDGFWAPELHRDRPRVCVKRDYANVPSSRSSMSYTHVILAPLVRGLRPLARVRRVLISPCDGRVAPPAKDPP